MIANPLQVRAIAHAKIKTDKIDAAVLAKRYASGCLPEVWMPDEATETLGRLGAQRAQVIQQMTRVKVAQPVGDENAQLYRKPFSRRLKKRFAAPALRRL